jgi:hypothetical protein
VPGLIAPATADLGLPTLQTALDADEMLEPLALAAGVPACAGLRCTAEVLACKPGQRCTIAYAFAASPGSQATGVAVIGKLYGRPVVAGRVQGWMRAVRDQTCGEEEPFGVPAPLAVLPELGLLVRERAPGIDLRHALGSPGGARAVALCARWLARLHAAVPPPDLKTKSVAHELGKIDSWRDQVRPWLSPERTRRLDRARRELHALARSLPACPPVMIHRDFYYANVLWDGARLWVLDFDELSQGDPLLDVAHFLAHVEVLAYRSTGRVDAYAAHASLFLRSYGQGRLREDEPRLRLYRAYTFLKLAATEAKRRRAEDWLTQLHVFTERACAEGER